MPDFETFQAYFKGVKIISTGPLVIEWYSDLWYLDAEYIAEEATIEIGACDLWHTLVPGILAEAAGEAAFSADKADTLGVEWMNYVAGPVLDILAKYTQQALDESYIPYEPTLGAYITEAEAQARYQNLLNWYQEKGHFWVGWGPFQLGRVDPVGGSLVLEKFEAFPDPSDKWLRFGEPKIAELEVVGPRVLPSAQDRRREYIGVRS